MIPLAGVLICRQVYFWGAGAREHLGGGGGRSSRGGPHHFGQQGAPRSGAAQRQQGATRAGRRCIACGLPQRQGGAERRSAAAGGVSHWTAGGGMCWEYVLGVCASKRARASDGGCGLRGAEGSGRSGGCGCDARDALRMSYFRVSQSADDSNRDHSTRSLGSNPLCFPVRMRASVTGCSAQIERFVLWVESTLLP